MAKTKKPTPVMDGVSTKAVLDYTEARNSYNQAERRKDSAKAKLDEEIRKIIFKKGSAPPSSVLLEGDEESDLLISFVSSYRKVGDKKLTEGAKTLSEELLSWVKGFLRPITTYAISVSNSRLRKKTEFEDRLKQLLEEFNLPEDALHVKVDHEVKEEFHEERFQKSLKENLEIDKIANLEIRANVSQKLVE